jgi:hypothetical protein
MSNPHIVLIGDVIHGQGYCEAHSDHLGHKMLVEYGWEYSHTTIINYYVGTFRKQYSIHTYKLGDTDYVCGVDSRFAISRPDLVSYTFHKLGSSQSHTKTYYNDYFEDYLRRKTNRITKKLAKSS